jgi:hypothetical protein
MVLLSPVCVKAIEAPQVWGKQIVANANGEVISLGAVVGGGLWRFSEE